MEWLNKMNAAFELQSSDEKVIDIAVKYGYDSASSFARAFSALHGISPTEARQTCYRLNKTGLYRTGLFFYWNI